MSTDDTKTTGAQVKVGSTGSKPEIVDRVTIARAAQPGGKREVVLSLDAESKG